MQKYYLWLIILLTGLVYGQSPFIGDWQGSIAPGNLNLGIYISFTESPEGIVGEIDIPAQGAENVPLEISEMTDSSSTFSIQGIPGNPTFEALLENDRITGIFRQGGQALDFELTAASNTASTSGVATVAQLLGDWQGEIQDIGLSLSLSLKDDAGTLKGNIVIPAQALDVPIIINEASENLLNFTIEGIPGNPTFNLTRADDNLEGQLAQGDQSFSVSLERSEQALSILRPQEPSLPYPYREEEVRYTSGDISLAGTLTLPETEAPYTAILLITGSGPQDRDESLAGHKPFLVLADYLTRAGFAVLRVDDRGMGESEGDNDASDYGDFSQDILAGVDFLGTREDIAEIGLLGHSEGGYTAPIAASLSADIRFIIMLASPSVQGKDILLEQNKLILEAAGASDELISSQINFLQRLFPLLEDNELQAVEPLLRETLEKQLLLAGEALSPEAFEMRLQAELEGITSRSFRAILFHDPQPYLNQLDIPVLAIYGEKDLQVPPAQSLAPLAQALAANPDVTIRVFPGLNHLMQTAESGSLEEYALIEETISPKVLEAIVHWLEARN